MVSCNYTLLSSRHRRADARTTTTTTGVGLSNKSSLGGFQSRGRRGRGEICVPLPSLCDQSVDILLQTPLFLDQPFRGQRAGDGESSVELRFCWEYSIGVRSRLIVSSGEREASKTQKSGTTSFISPTKTTTTKTMRKRNVR